MPSAPAPPPALLLPVIPAGKVPGAAAQLAIVKKNLAGPGNKPSSKGGRKTRRRLMSRKYCKKTPCRRMGFTQKASCRPYKNCYTRRK